jgi:signal transduction histidine kinase
MRKLEVVLLVGAAIAIQVFLATRHGFDPLEDGLAMLSAILLVVLVVRLSAARSRRRKELVLRILDELGQPLTVFQGYVSMLADGTIHSLNGGTHVLAEKCEEMRMVMRRLVQTVRESW